MVVEHQWVLAGVALMTTKHGQIYYLLVSMLLVHEVCSGIGRLPLRWRGFGALISTWYKLRSLVDVWQVPSLLVECIRITETRFRSFLW